MTYSRVIPVEFNHCDPAGIVFYPRYFEMTNSVVENFFGAGLGYSYARMMAEASGVPTAGLNARFLAPSRLGDILDFDLEIKRIGRTSVAFLLSCRCGGELRMTVDLTLVWVSGGRPAPWPDVLRAPMQAFMERAT